jgi:hypothetical protein
MAHTARSAGRLLVKLRIEVCCCFYREFRIRLNQFLYTCKYSSTCKHSSTATDRVGDPPQARALVLLAAKERI